MPKLVTQATVCVIRDSKRVFPEIGKPFNYTNAEVVRIKRVSPTALRTPVNEEAASEGVADEFETGATDKSGEKDGGKKKPTATKTPKRTAKQKAAAKTADPDAADDEDDDAVDEDGDDDASEDEDI
jgi:hypothetical protein